MKTWYIAHFCLIILLVELFPSKSFGIDFLNKIKNAFSGFVYTKTVRPKIDRDLTEMGIHPADPFKGCPQGTYAVDTDGNKNKIQIDLNLISKKSDYTVQCVVDSSNNSWLLKNGVERLNFSTELGVIDRVTLEVLSSRWDEMFKRDKSFFKFLGVEIDYNGFKKSDSWSDFELSDDLNLIVFARSFTFQSKVRNLSHLLPKNKPFLFRYYSQRMRHYAHIDYTLNQKTKITDKLLFERMNKTCQKVEDRVQQERNKISVREKTLIVKYLENCRNRDAFSMNYYEELQRVREKVGKPKSKYSNLIIPEKVIDKSFELY